MLTLCAASGWTLWVLSWLLITERGAWSHLKSYSTYTKETVFIHYLSSWAVTSYRIDVVLFCLCSLEATCVVVGTVLIVIWLYHTAVQQVLLKKMEKTLYNRILKPEYSIKLQRDTSYNDTWYSSFCIAICKPCRSQAVTRSSRVWDIARLSWVRTSTKPQRICKNQSPQFDSRRA